jgi:hypothetical protein
MRRVEVLLNGTLFRMLPGTSRSITVSLVGMPAGGAQINVVGVSRRGHRYASERGYHLCIPSVSHHAVKSLTLKG